MRHFAIRFIAVLAVVLLAADWNAWAQGPAAETVARPAVKKVAGTTPTKRSARAKPANGASEGIKVHGDWTIVIRNADGSVASRHEFKNALVDFAVLPLLLAHGGSVGQWSLSVNGPDPSTQPCVFVLLIDPFSGPTIRPSACTFVELPNGGNLSVTNTGTNLTLQGSKRAEASSPLTTVETFFVVCNPSQGPSLTCQGSAISAFTRKDISAQNIQVVVGQLIEVTVVISFS